MARQTTTTQQRRAVAIPTDRVRLAGDLTIPAGARGIVVFAHGSGSGRFSPRNRAVADALVRSGLATLLMDLLTREEEAVDVRTRHLRFDIALLARRVIASIDWLASEPTAKELPIGCFGASTGAAAALLAAAERPGLVGAVVSRGGRPDLAGEALRRVRAPTLLIVGGNDPEVLWLNQQALASLDGEARLEVVPGAGHLFEEPGALERVALLARDWFLRHLGRPRERDLGTYAMLAAVIFWLLASPFSVGAAVARWRPANRFVARHYWPVLVVGWLGVGLLLSRLFVLDGVQGDLATVVGAPLAGLSVWSRRGGGDDGDDEPEEDPPPDYGIDWDRFVEDFHAYAATRERLPAQV